MKEEYQQISMSDAEHHSQTLYMDGDIAILDDFNQLPNDHGSFKVNIFIIMVCVNGKMTVSINSKRYTVHPNEFLICMPNMMLNDCMMSPDFYGTVICFSSRVMLETMRMDSILWNKAFHIKEDPIVHVDREGVELFQAYSQVIRLRLQSVRRAYRKEVMTSLLCTCLYEILSELSSYVNSPGNGLLQQKDLLFKRFLELLSSQEVKPRNVIWYADKLCITPKYLSTMCKVVSGKTAFEWINEYVMIDVRHQLKYSTRSIKEVSDYLGFPNISFFGKYVKQHSGCNPSDYRKQLRQEEEKA